MKSLNSRKPLRALTQAAASVAPIALALATPALAATAAPFELPGPDLAVEVTRDGKTLPIAQVPALAEGDKVSVHAALPEGYGAEFILVSAFLRGATNPPPKDWIETAETWREKEKHKALDLTVPKGARQMVLLLVPDTGGAEGVLRDAVRGKPGEFVRASHDLDLASLDHSRLETFMAGIKAEIGHPQNLRKIAPPLASSLGIKLNEECLLRVAEEQASCLLENRENIVLNDVHSSSITDTLTGAPTALALQLSAVPEAGGGTYSPYIGVVRDVAKLLGAFSNPTFNYLPALTARHDDKLSLLLNAAPSFQKPKTVLVAAMPAVESDHPPRLRASDQTPVCAATPGAVLPVEGAPLIYSTGFAREMMATITAPSGQTVDLPVTAAADKGGYVLGQPLPEGFSGKLRARLHGYWGFTPFDGPEFAIQSPGVEAWKVADGANNLVIGRENRVMIEGSAPACLSKIVLRAADGAPRQVSWDVGEDGRLAITVPGDKLKPGPAKLELNVAGAAQPIAFTLDAVTEAARLDGFELHAGDREGLLTGLRLDQVQSLEFAGRTFRPEGLTRLEKSDELRLAASGTATDAAKTGSDETAFVTLRSGRKLRLPVTVAPERPQLHLIDRSVRAAPQAAGKKTLTPNVAGQDTLLPQGGELVFSVDRAGQGAFARGDVLEVASGSTAEGQDAPVLLRLKQGQGLSLATAQVAVARLKTSDLPPGTFGPLRLRLVREEASGESSFARTSDWQPLASLVRLPAIDAISCPAGSTAQANAGLPCTLTGQDLFLIDTIAGGADQPPAVTVSPGFTGASIAVPQPGPDGLVLRLRDAPDNPVPVQGD